MGGGVLNGVILGLVVSAVVLAAVSLSTGLPARHGEGDEAAAPAGSEVADADVDAPAQAVDEAADLAPDLASAAAPQVGDTTPETETSVIPPATDRATPAPGPAPRSAVAGAGGEAVALAAPVNPEPPPRLPRIDTQPSPALPAAPAAAPARDSAPGLPEPAAAPSVVIVPEIPSPAAPAPSPRFSAVADGSAGGAPPRRLQPPQGVDTLSAIDTARPPAPMPAPDAVDSAPPDAPDGSDPEPVAGPVTGQDPDPAPARRLPQVAPPEDAPTQEAPAVAPRLPQTGVAMAPDAAAGPEFEEVPTPDDLPEPPPPNALRDNAAPSDAPKGSPLLAIVLIDDPDTALDPADLTGFTFPVSFAIDPMRPDAASRAAALRALGHEVVILGAGTIPPGAAPSDVEVALAVARETMPQAVALMDDPASRIQADRPVLDATVAALADSGHGLIAFPRGLNAAEQSARRAAVPMATVFRLLDDQDQSAPVITRFLGRAAVAAGQEGAVVVVGHTRPDTVTALVAWASSGRADGVAIAPVSAVLLRAGE